MLIFISLYIFSMASMARRPLNSFTLSPLEVITTAHGTDSPVVRPHISIRSCASAHIRTNCTIISDCKVRDPDAVTS